MFISQAIKPTSFRRLRDALVTAREDGDATTAGLQRARELFNDRRLPRPAHGQIANADDETTESAFAENSFSIKIEPQLHDALEDERERMENSAQNTGAKSVATFEDNVDRELL